MKVRFGILNLLVFLMPPWSEAADFTLDPVAGDYRLLATSPCVEAGTNGYVVSAIDMDGNPRIMDGDLDGDPVVAMGAYEFPVLPVHIDIKPDSTTNPVNFDSKGRVPVAIMTTPDFDAAEVDSASMRFAGAVPIRYMLEDIDCDGNHDLLLHFQARELNLTVDSIEAMLIGQTHDGVLFVGVDTIQVMPRKR